MHASREEEKCEEELICMYRTVNTHCTAQERREITVVLPLKAEKGGLFLCT